MPIEFTAALLIILSSRWVYVLAKRFDKPKISYTAFAVLVFLLGGAVLSFVGTFIMLMTYGEFAFNYEMIVAGLFTLLGTLSVGIFHWILLRKWKKQKKVTPSNKDILDDRL